MLKNPHRKKFQTNPPQGYKFSLTENRHKLWENLTREDRDSQMTNKIKKRKKENVVGLLGKNVVLSAGRSKNLHESKPVEKNLDSWARWYNSINEEWSGRVFQPRIIIKKMLHHYI